MIKRPLLLVLALAAVFATVSVRADSPSGTISLEVEPFTTVANMRVKWVEGVLTAQGKIYKFKMKGLKPTIIGVRNLSIRGEVYNLKAASDLAGKYQKADPAGTTSIPGGKGLMIQNEKGVVIILRTINQRLVGRVRTVREMFKREGVPLDVVPEGLTIEQIQ